MYSDYMIKYHSDRLNFHLQDLPDVVENDPEMVQPTLDYIKYHKQQIKELSNDTSNS
jgi:hypothetical protein